LFIFFSPLLVHLHQFIHPNPEKFKQTQEEKKSHELTIATFVKTTTSPSQPPQSPFMNSFSQPLSSIFGDEVAVQINGDNNTTS
jgi:hypothetical protein